MAFFFELKLPVDSKPCNQIPFQRNVVPINLRCCSDGIFQHNKIPKNRLFYPLATTNNVSHKFIILPGPLKVHNVCQSVTNTEGQHIVSSFCSWTTALSQTATSL